MPKARVIMSVYNGEKYLPEAIESILDQTLDDFEFIIVNDGSTDGSSGILDSYSKQDTRIRIIRNDLNIGLTRSLNRALESAKGPYVARMDADDISSSGRLEKQVSFLEKHPDLGLAGCYAVVIDGSGATVKNVVMPEKVNELIRKRNYYLHGSIMVRTDIIRELGGYDEEMRYAQDYELWLRLSKTHKMGVVPEFIYKCRVHGDAILNRKYFSQIFYTALAKSKALHNKNRYSMSFLLELLYCYGYIYKMGIPYLLRRLSLIK